MKTPEEVVRTARLAFESGRTRPEQFREQQLQSLLKLVQENEDEIIDAIQKDLHRPKFETSLVEIGTVVGDIQLYLNRLRDWMNPERPSKILTTLLDELQIIKEPYGVVLIISTWNYPFMTSLRVLLGAIAAGNCVVIKPSELVTASEELISKLIPKYLDNECFQVVCGGADTTTVLLKEQFDYIFYTGSAVVGKIVHTAAAKHLTPTTLELGGKCPVYVDGTVDVEVAAKRILWGKFINAGQTCIGPDYVLCSKEVQEKFLVTSRKILMEWYGDDAEKSPDYSRIVNERHFERVQKLLDGVNIAIGGKTNASSLYVEPTIVINPKLTDPVMQEEIFGPILSIYNVDSAAEAISFINAREKPLALYLFSNNRRTIDLILSNVSSGGVCVNDTLMHVMADMPFGGVGASGMGRYHGKYTFETFTHHKNVMIKNLGALGEKLGAARYPPYTEGKAKFMALVSQRRDLESYMRYLPALFAFGLGMASTYIYKVYETARMQ